MKSLVVAATVIALTVGFVTYTKYTDDKLEGQFADFITQFNKNYGSVEEYAFRFEAYKSNLETIKRLNAKNPEAKFEINQFGDFTQDDMKKIMGFGGKQIENVQHVQAIGATPVDWSGMWSKIKNQGICGASWAFSSTAVFEARHALKNLYKTVKTYYSDQELIDCVKSKDSQGCSGGVPGDAFLLYLITFKIFSTNINRILKFSIVLTNYFYLVLS